MKTRTRERWRDNGHRRRVAERVKRRKGGEVPAAISLPLACAASPRLSPAFAGLTCVCREAWFSFDYRYGMHLRRIMHPRGGTFARSQAYPGVRPSLPDILRRARRMLPFTPFARLTSSYDPPSSAQRYSEIEREDVLRSVSRYP